MDFGRSDFFGDIKVIWNETRLLTQRPDGNLCHISLRIFIFYKELKKILTVRVELRGNNG